MDVPVCSDEKREFHQETPFQNRFSIESTIATGRTIPSPVMKPTHPMQANRRVSDILGVRAGMRRIAEVFLRSRYLALLLRQVAAKSQGHSVNQLQRKLNLPEVPAVLLITPNPEPLIMFAGSPMFTMLNRLKNSARNCRSISSLPLLRRPERRVLDHGKIVVIVSGTAKCIAPKRSEASAVRPTPSGQIDRNREVRSICRALSEVIFAHLARRRQVRLANLVRTVRSDSNQLPSAEYRNNTVNGEPLLIVEMLSSSHPRVSFFVTASRKSTLSRCRSCATLRLKNVRHVERRRSLFRMRIETDPVEQAAHARPSIRSRRQSLRLCHQSTSTTCNLPDIPGPPWANRSR